MKNLRQIFVLTKRDQRVIVVMMILLLLGTLAGRYRRGHTQIAHLPSRPAVNASSSTAEEPVTTKDQP